MEAFDRFDDYMEELAEEDRQAELVHQLGQVECGAEWRHAPGRLPCPDCGAAI